jgi:hypothetical protein
MSLHDPTIRSTLRSRLESLRPDAARQWGRMSIDQMLWHVNTALEQSLGTFRPRRSKTPLPRPILKFVVLNMPWPKDAPTNPDFVASAPYDFEAERRRCLRLIDDFVSRDIRGDWPENEDFGRMSGRDWSKLMAKHLDHHLKQFGV